MNTHQWYCDGCDDRILTTDRDMPRMTHKGCGTYRYGGEVTINRPRGGQPKRSSQEAYEQGDPDLYAQALRGELD